MERRLGKKSSGFRTPTSPLPVDYLRMVQELFTSHFDEGLKAFSKLKAEPRFEATGAIYPDEVVLSVSLGNEGVLAATTVHASCDFDPKASAPTVQDLLGACVDAVGGVFGELLDPKKPERLEQLADESLAALEDIPYDWTALEVEKRKVYLKVDKSNPSLDQMTEDWLAKNDPKYAEREEEEQKETEKLFFTGPKKGGEDSEGSGTIH